MDKVGMLIEDKLTEFRIDGKTPEYLGLSPKVYAVLVTELNSTTKTQNNSRLEKFLGLKVFVVGGPAMPRDGIYIHDKNASKHTSLQILDSWQ